MFAVTHFLHVLSNQATHKYFLINKYYDNINDKYFLLKYFLKRGVQSTCSKGSLTEDIAFLA